MKKEYSIPELFVNIFRAEDIITITISNDTSIDLDDEEEFNKSE